MGLKDISENIDWDKMLDFLEKGDELGRLSEQERKFLDELKKVRTEASDELRAYYALKTEKKWMQLSAHIADHTTFSDYKKKQVSLWPRIGITAVVLIGICLVLYLNRSERLNRNNTAKNIVPGSNKAELTFADGRIVHLNVLKSGVVINTSGLTYNDGTHINVSLSKDLEENNLVPENMQLSTPKGGTYQVILPDGTRVWLNASSSLKFPATFKNLKERKVELEGEGYFIVVHNAKQPFKVQTSTQIVEDIGTAFNVDAYSDAPVTKTTLLEGAAKVYPLAYENNRMTGKTGDVILVPDQQAQLKKGEHIIKVQQINASDAVAWKNGEFIFNSETLANIMRKVERWYDVDVNYSSNLAEIKFSGTISRYDNISKLLDMMESTGEVKFKVTEKTITVTR